jgi:transcriptional regulator with XRE-family HTH domain
METANAAELLRKARLRHGISQKALAMRAGLTEPDIAELERGQLSPTVDDLVELLHLVGEDLVVYAKRHETGIDRTLNQGNLELSTEQRVRKGLELADFVRENRSGPPANLGRSLQPGPLVRPLHVGAVDFVVVGSMGGLAYGSAYPTYDLDVAYLNEPENLRRLGTLDVVGEIPGIRSYEELRRDAHRELIAGVPVRVASLDHLIAMKRVSNQRKDQLMVMEYVELAELHLLKPSPQAPAPGSSRGR